MAIEILLEPKSGEVRRVARAASNTPPERGLWKIVCDEAGAVRVLGKTASSDDGLLGTCRWTGTKIDQRHEPDDRISSKAWQHISEALYQAHHASRSSNDAVAVADPAMSANPASTTPSSMQGEPATTAVTTTAGHPPPDPTAAIAALNALDPSTGLAALDQALAADGSVEDVTPRARQAHRVHDDAAPRRSANHDRRSGWWAFGAAGVAIAATVAAFVMMPAGDTIALATAIALGVLALGLAIYGLGGLGTRCPSCKAWYRRQLTSTENLGTSTTTRQISKPVYDNQNKQIGTTYETATYEVTQLRYHYRCKECSNRWTGSGSSERRIS